MFSGSWGALVIILRGARELAHNFRDIGSLAKEQKKKKKKKGNASILFDFLKNPSASRGLAPQTPLVTSRYIYFHTILE